MITGLLRGARNAYGAAIRKALGEAGCDDVPASGIFVIGAIARNNAPLGEIIKGLGTSKQAVGQLIDTLVLRGYVAREMDPEDRRRLVLTLTERGKAAAVATAAVVGRIEAEVTAQLGAEYVSHTRETLAAIMQTGFAMAAVEPGAAPASETAVPRFKNRRLDAAVFETCALADAKFCDVNLADAAFENVNLKGAKFHNVNLSGVTITNAKIEGLKIFGYDIPALIKAERARG